MIAHEHLWWDHAAVLVQLGLVHTAALPVHGVEIAQRLRALSVGGAAPHPGRVTMGL